MVQLNEILALETNERIELVEFIWDSVDKDTISNLSTNMKQLLEMIV